MAEITSIYGNTIRDENTYTKAEADTKFASTTTLNSALADNAAVNRFLVYIDEMVETNTDGTWDTSTDGEYIYTINNTDFTVNFNAGGWVTNISGDQTELDTGFKIYLWKNKIIQTEEFDDVDYTLYATTSLTGSNVAFHLEQHNRYDTSLWEEVFLPSDPGYREIEIQQVGSKVYFNAYLNVGEESGTASTFSDLWVKLIPNVNLNRGFEDDYYRTQRQLDAAIRELQKSGGVIREIGTPDYDNRIQFTQADLPYTVPCDGYLYIGGWQSRVSLKYKDADNNYVSMAFASTSGEIAEYGMYPVTKGMVLEYNAIGGNEAQMYIVPMKYNAIPNYETEVFPNA